MPVSNQPVHYKDLAMLELACKERQRPNTRTTSRPASTTCPKCLATPLVQSTAKAHATAKSVPVPAVIVERARQIASTKAERMEAARQEAEDAAERYPEDEVR